MGHEVGAAQSLPGMGQIKTADTVQFLRDNSHIVRRGIRIHKDTNDIRSVGKTHKLQGGLILVRVEAGGNKNLFVDTAHADAPVAAAVKDAVILMESLSMFDNSGDAVREDKNATGLVHGFVDNAKLEFTTVDAVYIANIKAILKLVEFFAPVP